MSLKLIGIFIVVGMVAGGLLVGKFYGDYRYSHGYQAGLAEHPTETQTVSDLTGEDILKIREDAVKEYVRTHKGTVTVSKPDQPPVTIAYDDTETYKGYETLLAELYEEFNVQLAEKNKEIYDLKNAPKPTVAIRKFGLGVAGGYIYPKLALAGLGVEWKKTEVIPLVGYDFDTDGVKYGGLLRFRF